jgi:acyl carrier protein
MLRGKAVTQNSAAGVDPKEVDCVQIERQLLAYIQQEFEQGSSLALRSDHDLIKAGIVDSMGVLQIVAFIERAFGCGIREEEITVVNFRSVASLAQFVAMKVSSAR